MGKMKFRSSNNNASQVNNRVVIPTFNFGEPDQPTLIVEIPNFEMKEDYKDEPNNIIIEYRDIQVPVETIKYVDHIVEKIIEVPVERIVEKLVEIEKLVEVPVEKIVEIERIVEVESKQLQELVQLQHSQLQKLEAQVSAKLKDITKLKYILGALVIIAIIGVIL